MDTFSIPSELFMEEREAGIGKKKQKTKTVLCAILSFSKIYLKPKKTFYKGKYLLTFVHIDQSTNIY